MSSLSASRFGAQVAVPTSAPTPMIVVIQAPNGALTAGLVGGDGLGGQFMPGMPIGGAGFDQHMLSPQEQAMLEHQVEDQQEMLEHQVKDQQTMLEHQVKDQQALLEHQVKDRQALLEQQVKDQQALLEQQEMRELKAMLDPQTLREPQEMRLQRAMLEQQAMLQRQAIEQQAMLQQQTMEQQAMLQGQTMDQQSMLEHQVKDQQAMLKQQAMEQKKAMQEPQETQQKPLDSSPAANPAQPKANQPSGAGTGDYENALSRLKNSRFGKTDEGKRAIESKENYGKVLKDYITNKNPDYENTKEGKEFFAGQVKDMDELINKYEAENPNKDGEVAPRTAIPAQPKAATEELIPEAATQDEATSTQPADERVVKEQQEANQAKQEAVRQRQLADNAVQQADNAEQIAQVEQQDANLEAKKQKLVQHGADLKKEAASLQPDGTQGAQQPDSNQAAKPAQPKDNPQVAKANGNQESKLGTFGNIGDGIDKEIDTNVKQLETGATQVAEGGSEILDGIKKIGSGVVSFFRGFIPFI